MNCDTPTLPDIVIETSTFDGSEPYLGSVHPDDLESLAALIDLARVSDAHAIVRVRDDAGGWTLVEHRARPEPGRVVLERTDVTARERTWARQGRSEAYWRTILRNGHEAIVVLDPDTHTIRHASDHLGELLGEPAEQLVGRSLASVVAPADVDALGRGLQQLDDGTGRAVVEMRLLVAGTEPRWVEGVVSDARHDPDVAAVVVNIRDIEDRKRAEQQLRSSEHLFRILLSQLADGALVVDPVGVVRFASGRAAEVFGVAVDDLVGRPVPLRFREGEVCLTTEPGLPFASLAHLPHELAGPGGRWFELTVHDLTADPVVNGSVLSFRDVTERRDQELQLRTELDEDPLTGLLNRRGFDDRVRRRLALGERMQLAFLDLNGFKAVNDTHGHAVGDRLLQEVADRLREATRSDDLIARMGGDEFVVAAAFRPSLVPTDLVDRLAHTVAGRYRLDGFDVEVGVSTGWSELGDDVELEVAMRLADERMYADKRAQAVGTITRR